MDETAAAEKNFTDAAAPIIGASDYTCQGDLLNAGAAVAGDIAGVLTFGAGKVLRVGSKSYEMSKRVVVGGLALEGSIGIYRTGEGTYLLSQGEGGEGEIAEGLLRLFGVSASLVRGKGSEALEKVAENAPVRTPAPKPGDLFERTFDTTKGPVGLLAEVEVNGTTLHLKDLVIYGQGQTPLTGLTREVLAARSQLMKEAKSMGFEKLRITGERVQSSSSANPGHCIDVTIDLTK